MAFFIASCRKRSIMVCVMNYNTLTPEISALARNAMFEEGIDVPENVFGTLHEELKLEMLKEYALELEQTIYCL